MGVTARRLSFSVQVEHYHIREPQEVIYGGNILAWKNRSINTKVISLQLHTSNPSLVTLHNYCLGSSFYDGNTPLDICPNLCTSFFPHRYLTLEIHGANGSSLPFSRGSRYQTLLLNNCSSRTRRPFSIPGQRKKKNIYIYCLLILLCTFNRLIVLTFVPHAWW